MKTMFRKALTVLGSAAMIGATVGAALAASTYPAPFTSNTAIVVGANAAPSDSVAAASIAADLDSASAGSSIGGDTTVMGGESYKFEKTSTKFHLGNTITGVISSALDEDQLPTLLAEGVYVDNDNDEFDYTQSINMAASTLSMFEDNDYADNIPTVGFRIASAADVLTYNLTFTDEPLFSDLSTTDIMLMGKQYYVLSADYTQMTLLDSAADTIVAEGETTTLTAGSKSYTVGIEYIGETSVKLKVNGEVTNSLAEGQTYKLDDGSYVGVKEVLYSAKDTGISKVEFSIGNGKLVLTDGSDVELNEDSIDGLTVDLINGTATGSLGTISIDWNADDDLFITPTSSATMPGFEAVKLSFGGLKYPAEEAIKVSAGAKEYAILDNFPLKDTTYDIPILYQNGTNFVAIGQDYAENLIKTSTFNNLTFDGDVDDAFIVSWSDGRDAESYIMRAKNWDDTSGTNKTTFQKMVDGDWTDVKVDRANGDSFDVGNAALLVGAINDSTKTVVVKSNSANTNFRSLYSREGMMVYLPFQVTFTSGTNTTLCTDYPKILNGSITLQNGTTLTCAAPTSYNLTFSEEDEDGNIGDGDNITVNIGLNSQTPKEVTVTAYYGGEATEQEIEDSDVMRNFVYSALATEILYDTGDNQDFITLMYHGDEVAADVYITSSDAIVSGSGSESGVMTVLDSAVSTVSGKNLVVVGGSAINSVAAELLGGAYSEGEFTSKTGIGAGEFLIQSFDRGGKTALLVAGYNAADTTKAATYLVNNDVDTSVGKKYKGTAANEASLVVA